MSDIKIINNSNFKGSDKIQKFVKSKVYQNYKEEQDLELYFAVMSKLVREQNNMTQSQLAEKMEVKQEAVARLESGKTGMTFATVKKFLRASGIKLVLVAAKKRDKTNVDISDLIKYYQPS